MKPNKRDTRFALLFYMKPVIIAFLVIVAISVVLKAFGVIE